MRSEFLFHEWLAPVASPRLLEKYGKPSLAALPKLPLLSQLTGGAPTSGGPAGTPWAPAPAPKLPTPDPVDPSLGGLFPGGGR